MPTFLKRLVVLLAVYAERYVLSVWFLYLASGEITNIRNLLSGRIFPESNLFVDVGHHLILLLMSLFTGLLLLLGRRPAALPQKLSLVVIPLISTFYYVMYFTVPKFPPAWRVNLVPPDLQMALFAAGFACIVIGPCFSLWGLYHLGRSFGIFAIVRKVVLTGPYRLVRHPMYTGWVCLCCGLLLANFSGAYFLLVPCHIGLLLYRARLEETELAAQSPEYREHLKHSRFIFPELPLPGRHGPAALPGDRQSQLAPATPSASLKSEGTPR